MLINFPPLRKIFYSCGDQIFFREVKMALDSTDIRILDILQQDASLPVSDIAGRVGLSVTPCWRRIQRLEEQG